MDVLRTGDNSVVKYLHYDGTETIIKLDEEKNKYSVFVSSSLGCPLGCKFCYLTTKKVPFHMLKASQILDNFKEAVGSEVNLRPEMRSMYLKLSWMGMGDAFLLKPLQLKYTSEKILSWAISDTGLAQGVDGVDFSTVLPESCLGWPHALATLNDCIENRHRRNSYNSHRSAVRLFYSLHSTDPDIRKRIIPSSGSKGPMEDLQTLNKFRHWYGIDVILHHMFFDRINDNSRELSRMELITNTIIKDAELRILRFNSCEGSTLKEASNFDELLEKYTKLLPKVRCHNSTGGEINAACGQFTLDK